MKCEMKLLMFNFCSSAFLLNNPSQKTFLDDNWYFAVTPFPSNSYGLTASDKSFPFIEESKITHLTDVFYPLSDQNPNQIPVSRFTPHTFLLILEISDSTKNFIPSFLNNFREYFSVDRPIFFSILLICGNKLIFPLIQNKGQSFSLSTFPDTSCTFDLKHESVYFNMNTSRIQFLKYLDLIENIEITKPFISVSSILKCMFPFIKSLKNSTWFVLSELIESPFKEMEDVSNQFFESSMDVDFFCIGLNRHNYLAEMIKKCNCSLKYYGSSGYSRLALDLIYCFLKPRTVFCRMDILFTDAMKVANIYGNGVKIDDNAFKAPVLTVNNTFHVFIKPNLSKLQNTPAKIWFRVRYVDAGMNCFMRYIPFDCSSRTTYPEALISAAISKILYEKYKPNDATRDLMHLDLSNNDLLFRKRFDLVTHSLNLINEDNIFLSFVLSNDPHSIFQFFSPICLKIGSSGESANETSAKGEIAKEWKVVTEADFGKDIYLLQLYEHQFIFVTTDTATITKEDAQKMAQEIDPKGKLEMVNYRDYNGNMNLLRVFILIRNYNSSKNTIY
ncbi:hypothetical protein TRFO_14431 [Tritrichomonas foetus]|uniref:Uncharacterized protein n=1 Tax=Tritrichomonas foetus TaxID=1144522 RepID=A0A1J4KW27_9EUKA|nr:hypothetical protein TRFO_14431 [Tritrichomonas foetus]|eukprot:OHT15088.1 hypothetical protein TRFO_14431 [Tritrichomonas foetus]